MSTKKTIIYVWKSPYPWDIRVEKVCKSLNKEYNVIILARWGGEKNKEEIIDNITIRRVGFQKSSKVSTPLSINPLWKKEITKAVRDFKADLLIVREIMLGTISGKVARKLGIPVIMDMAENYPAVMKGWEHYNNSALKRLLNQKVKLPENTERVSTKLMDGIFFVCEENKNRIISEINYKGKAEVIYNTPPLNFFDFKRFEIDRPYKNIAYHGYINTERNLNTIVEIIENQSEFNFEIWGDGPVLNEIKSKAKTNKVKFHGSYKHSILKDIIITADFGILPFKVDNHINNTISNKLFDYMACGLPVLTSEAKPMIRLINNHNIGSYFNFDNSEEFLNEISKFNNEDFKEMGRNGIKFHQKKYNWEKDEEKLLSFVKGFI